MEMKWLMTSKGKIKHFKDILIPFIALILISVAAQGIDAQQVYAKAKITSVALVRNEGMHDGDVLISFDIIDTKYKRFTEGIAFDGTHICALIVSEEYDNLFFELHKFNPYNGSLISTIKLFNDFSGSLDQHPHIAWDGSYFWV